MESVENRRIATRHPCDGVAEILKNGVRCGWGKVIDISNTGCYVETAHPVAAEAEVQLHLTIADLKLQINARVVWLTPQVGMGLAFVINTPEDEAQITAILKKVSTTFDLPAVQVADDPKVGRAAIHIKKEVAEKILLAVVEHMNKRGSMTREELIALVKALQ